MVDVDDKKHLYEVKDPDGEYDGTNDDFPHRPITNIKINDQIHAPKWPMYVLIGIQAIVILALIILLGVNGVTLTHLNTLDVCDNSASASTGAFTSGGPTSINTTCNCTAVVPPWPSTVNCTGSITGHVSCDSLTWQIGQIVNMSKMILAYQNDDNVQGQSQAAFIMQMSQYLTGNLTQLANTAQRTEGKVDMLQSSLDDQMANISNVTDVLATIWQSQEDAAARLTSIVSSLSNIRSTGISTAAVIDDIILAVNELLEIQNASAIFNSITTVSCADIKRVLPSSPSGYYHVNARDIYCDMGELCNITGAWTRIGYLDMSDGTQSCPTGLRYYAQNGVRACGRPNTAGASCSPSVSIPTNGINYTQICGRVTGYQRGTPDANAPGSNHNNINSYYTDGVSLTRGNPRQHIWTFMSGYTQRQGASCCICPCATGSGQTLQSFVGNNYYCESGNPNWGAASWYLFNNDPLWDGNGCGGAEGACCTANPLQPWFLRDFGNSTSSADLEIRVCGDEGVNGNEDTPIGYYEIYVK